MDDLKSYIREVPDFPKPGILFYDISTLLNDPLGLRMTVDRFTWLFSGMQVERVVGIESRGFMFAPTIAYRLNAGFVPVRKPGKLPAAVTGEDYELEYGSDRLEVHTDAVAPGERVLIIDDLLATGGTALAATRLIETLGGTVVSLGFVAELSFLEGRQRIADYSVESLITY